MSIDMNLPSAQSQSSGISTFVSNKNRGYSELITALNQFIMMTPNLQGATYESAKSYAQSVFLPLAQGAIMLNEAFSKSVSNYVSGYCSKVIGKSLKSSELEEKIAQRRAAITRLHEQMDRLLRMDKPQAKLLNSLKRRIDFELETVEELEELLQKLTSFHAESASYFDNLDALYTAVQQGLSQLTSSWNPATNTFVLPAVKDMGWASIINQQWHDKTTERAKTIIAKVESGKDLTSDELNELGGYLMENPESKLYDKGMRAFLRVSKLEVEGVDNTYFENILTDSTLTGISETLKSSRFSSLVGELYKTNYSASAKNMLSYYLLNSIDEMNYNIGKNLSVQVGEFIGQGIDEGIGDTLVSRGLTSGGTLVGTAVGTVIGLAKGESLGQALVPAFTQSVISGSLTTLATIAIGATPVGWAAVGVAVVASIATIFIYENDVLGVKTMSEDLGKALDQSLESVGQAISDFTGFVGGWFSAWGT